jgi:hypothetical protein
MPTQSICYIASSLKGRLPPSDQDTFFNYGQISYLPATIYFLARRLPEAFTAGKPSQSSARSSGRPSIPRCSPRSRLPRQAGPRCARCAQSRACRPSLARTATADRPGPAKAQRRSAMASSVAMPAYACTSSLARTAATVARHPQSGARSGWRVVAAHKLSDHMTSCRGKEISLLDAATPESWTESRDHAQPMCHARHERTGSAG